MKLCSILYRGFKIPGHRFKGKVRMVKIVTPMAQKDLINDYKIEEQNLLYLRHPFLTLEQSTELTKELEKREFMQCIERVAGSDGNLSALPYKDKFKYLKPTKTMKLIKSITARDDKFSAKSTKIMDQLKVLKPKDDWDIIK